MNAKRIALFRKLCEGKKFQLSPDKQMEAVEVIESQAAEIAALREALSDLVTVLSFSIESPDTTAAEKALEATK